MPPPSLADRLRDARREAEAPAARVAGLEASLADALARGDYAAAQSAKDDLQPAREEHAIARAAVTALEAAVAEVGRQRAADEQELGLQRQRDEALRRLETARRAEAGALDALDAEVETMWAALEAVKLSFRRGQQLEQQAGQARAEQNQARYTLGELPNGVRASAPNKMSALIEYRPGLREVLKCSR